MGKAAFTATSTNGSKPFSTIFTDQSTNTPTSWLWNFGDNTATSTLQNPSHTYTVAGTYSVTLTATNNNGSNTLTKTNYINVSNSSLVASFTANRTTAKIGSAINFTDTSTGNPTRWRWLYGDGFVSNSKNPIHVYYKKGTFTVKLTVSNGSSSNSLTKTNYITIN